MLSTANLVGLPAFIAGSCDVNAIVDTPQGSQNKFKFDEQTGLFALGGAMPAGSVFPFEFGFIPSRLAEMATPSDLLILLDAPTFVGCLVPNRLIGVIAAEQTEKGKTERNDRLVAVAVQSRRHEHVRELRELPKQLLAEVEHFFVSYNEIKGKKFNPLGRYGSARALALVRKGCKQAAWLKKPS